MEARVDHSNPITINTILGSSRMIIATHRNLTITSNSKMTRVHPTRIFITRVMDNNMRILRAVIEATNIRRNESQRGSSMERSGYLALDPTLRAMDIIEGNGKEIRSKDTIRITISIVTIATRSNLTLSNIVSIMSILKIKKRVVINMVLIKNYSKLEVITSSLNLFQTPLRKKKRKLLKMRIISKKRSMNRRISKLRMTASYPLKLQLSIILIIKIPKGEIKFLFSA
jgi:hypothetical protein